MKKSKILYNKFYEHNRFNLIMAVLGTAILSIAILCVPYLMQQIVDFIGGNNENSWTRLALLGSMILLMELFSGICTYYFKTAFSTKAVAQYREYAFSELMHKDVQSFHNKSSSIYLSALVNDISSIEQNFLSMIPIIFQVIICGIGTIIIMLSYSVELTLIAVLISLIPFIVSLLCGKNLSDIEISLSDKNSEYIASLKDIFGGFSTVKSFKSEEAFIKIHNKECDNVRIHKKYREKVIERINYSAAISGYITNFSILFASILFSFYDESITVGTIIAFSQLIDYLIDPVTSLPGMFADAKASISLVEKLGNILDNNKVTNANKELSKLKHCIAFKNISYVYKNDVLSDKTNVMNNKNEIALKNISLNFSVGKCYILVGASGSGKSTLLKLIMKILTPDKGVILYDDIEITNVGDDEVYKSIAYIQQETVIFDTSIINNITMYQDFSENEIHRAINQAGLTELVNKKGLDFRCGENGSYLSGGERQRIAIARSLMKNTSVILADEITASLDRVTASHVISSILNLENITKVLILHDLDENILKQADEIIAFKDGYIKERGSFEDLINNRNYFYSLFTISST